MGTVLWILGCGLAVGAAALIFFLRRRGFGRWLIPYVLESPRRRLPGPSEDVHVLLCIADHFEPKTAKATPAVAQARVAHWVQEYPRQLGEFRDSDGRPPRHTFFYPIEEYEPEYLDALTELCRAGYGEIEVHLHHNQDTPAGLREKLLGFKELLSRRHSLLARRKDNGAVTYGFVHGNWALCNSRPDGSWCGVNEELGILRATGCYADFTFPSAPDPTQPRKVNKLYYATDRPGRPRAYDAGAEVGAGPVPPNSLLLIQGPLLLDWGKRKWGVLPGLENGCLQGSQPPAIGRLDKWLRARIQVPGRPDWFFVKLYAHGAEEETREALLGAPMTRFHEALAERAKENPRFRYHYVTAREMYNLVKAAEAGWKGSVAHALDYELTWNGCPQAVLSGK